MFLVQILLVLFTFRPAFASNCDAALAIKPEGVTIEPAALDQMADVLELSTEERASIQSYGKFVAEVIEARSQGHPLHTLHSPHLNAQSIQLRDFLISYIEDWPRRQAHVQDAIGRAAARLESEIESLEKELRSGNSEAAANRTRNSIRGVLTRISERMHGGPAALSDFEHFIQHMASSPERQLFEMKQRLPKLRQSIAERRAQSRELADRARDVLIQIGTILETRGDDIDLQSFLQLEIAVAVVNETENRGFLATKEGLSEEMDLNSYSLKFEEVEAGLKAWISGAAKNIGGELYSLVADRIERMKKRGTVLLPIIGNLSHKESLALAFLPIAPIRFQNKTSWVSDMHAGPQRGSVVTAYDISGTSGDTVYSDQALRKRSPQAWIDAINRSFNNWYLMLGGHREPAPLERHNPAQEALVRSLLYTARYIGLHEATIDWTESAQLVRYLFRDYLDFGEHELFNPNIMSFIRGSGPEFFSALGVPRDIEEDDVTQTLDKLLARLARNPELNLTQDPHLKVLLERFPTTAYSAKIFVLRAIKGTANRSRGLYSDIEPI